MSDPIQNPLIPPPDDDKRKGSFQPNTTGPILGDYSESEPQSTRASSRNGDDHALGEPSTSASRKIGLGRSTSTSNLNNEIDSGSTPPLEETAATDPQSVSTSEQATATSSEEPMIIHYGKLLPPSGPPSTSIIKNNPHSKTAIGRLTYLLKDLPELFVAELLTSREENANTKLENWVAVEHSKIRRYAVKEFLSVLKLDCIAYDIAINQNAHGVLDHVIAPLEGNTKDLEEGLTPGTQLELNDTKKKARKVDIDSGADFHRSVGCAILQSDGELNDCHKADLYWKSFSSLIRMRTSQAVDATGEITHAEVIQDSSLISDQFKKVDPLNKSEREKLEAPMEPGTGLPLGLRIFPFVNEHRRLHLDFDIVPHAPEGYLHDIVFEMFGKTSLLGKIPGYLKVLTDVLKDLEVRCAYAPSTKAEGGKSELLKADDVSRGRRFCIRQVAMPDDVPDFIAYNETHTVSSFFNKYVLEKGQQLLYPELPVVADDKDHWVPLEMLVVQHAQALRSKRFRPRAKEAAHSVLSSEHKAKIREAGQVFLDRINVLAWAQKNGKLFGTAEGIDFVPNIRAIPKPTATLSRKTLNMIVSDRHVPIGIIENADTNDTDKDILPRVRAGLQAQRTGEPTYEINNKIHARIQVAKDFTETKKNSLVRNVMKGTTKANKPKILLGIMEKSDVLTKQLHAHVDRDNEALLVDVSKIHLRERFDEFKTDKAYFPLNVRAKFNFMLGGTNFNTEVLKVASGKDLSRFMIVGAHIKRPSHWETYAPSISAVVASKDSKALQFPGSVRIQKSVALYHEHTKNEKTTVNSWVNPAIQDLDAMMVERFKAWSDEQTPPTRILYYRDSINFDDKAIVDEYHLIKEAYMNVWGFAADPQITILVYNKNAQLTFLAPAASDDDAALVEPMMAFTAGSPKNAYYVLKNEIGLTQGELEELTININCSSQLSSQTDQVNKALPLVWAAKLAARVNDYFQDRFAEDAKKHNTAIKGTHYDRQENRVNFVKETLLGSGGANPWNDGLNDKMFYL